MGGGGWWEVWAGDRGAKGGGRVWASNGVPRTAVTTAAAQQKPRPRRSAAGRAGGEPGLAGRPACVAVETSGLTGTAHWPGCCGL